MRGRSCRGCSALTGAGSAGAAFSTWTGSAAGLALLGLRPRFLGWGFSADSAVSAGLADASALVSATGTSAAGAGSAFGLAVRLRVFAAAGFVSSAGAGEAALAASGFPVFGAAGSAGFASSLRGRPRLALGFSVGFRDSALASASRMAKAISSISIFFWTLMPRPSARPDSCSLFISFSSNRLWGIKNWFKFRCDARKNLWNEEPQRAALNHDWTKVVKRIDTPKFNCPSSCWIS